METVYAYAEMSFPITCTACHKTFTISDEIYEKKVAGRVVTIKCKSCGQGIRVDGIKGPGAPAPAGIAAAQAPAATPPAAAGDEPLWAVDYPDGQDREFTTAEVVAEIERGAVERTTLVWREGMAEWLELHQVPELARELDRIEARKKAAAAKAAPVHRPRAPMPTVTGLAGLPVTPKPRAPQATPAAATPLPKPPAVATPLPKPPAAATPLPKPRAAQPSAPALPKPAPPPPAPPPLAPSRLPVAAPPPLAPVTTPPPLPPHVADATPPLPTSVAKAVSAPPQVPAFPATAASHGGPAPVASHAGVEWPETKSRKPLVIGGAIAALLIAGGAAFALSGEDPPPPPSTPIAAAPPTPSPTTPQAPEPPPEPTSATATPPETTQQGADTASGSDPVVTAPDPGATPGAGFAELFAAGARKAEAKGAAGASTERFDPAATKAPLAQAATEAQACKQSGGPTGKVTVVVTFNPSGKVSSATITEPPFAGTATGACISSALKRATIAPFSGLPGTVSKTFSIL